MLADNKRGSAPGERVIVDGRLAALVLSATVLRK